MRLQYSATHEKRYLWLLLVIGFLSRCLLMYREPSVLAMRPLVDDSFYVFSITRQLAQGRIPSIDGVHLTNGFQPLIAYLYVPLYWLSGGEDWLFVRMTFVLNALFFAGTVYLIAGLVKSFTRNETPKFQSQAAIFAVVLATISISFFQHTTNGLETGLVTMLLLGSLVRYAKLMSEETRSSTREWLMLGVVLGLTVLARIDSALFVAAIGIVEVFRRKIKQAVIVSATALAVSMPWWLFNYFSFGSLMPISGQAERAYGSSLGELLDRSFETISDIIFGIFYLPNALDWKLRIACTCTFLGICFVFFRGKKAWRFLRELTLSRVFVSYICFALTLLIFYTFFFGAAHYTERYLQPIRILWFILAPIAIVRAVVAGRTVSTVRVRVGISIAAIWLLYGLAFSTNRYLIQFRPVHYSEFYYTGLWAREHSKDKMGMLQSGTVGFIAPNVVNLDGKVNSDALHARLRGQLGKYVIDQHFTYIMDWKQPVEDIAGETARFGVIYDSVGRIGNVQIMKQRL